MSDHTNPLGRALRSWRDRADPRSAGFGASGPRRAPGLRREELAVLAGVSAEYVVRLEQGRAGSPSAQVLRALARALSLTGPETRHLFLLAGQPPPEPGTVDAHVTPAAQRLLRRLGDTPLGLYDATWTLVEWNPAFAALMGDPSGLSKRERNVPWRHFSASADRVEHTAEQARAFESAVVADLRAASARHPDDPGLRALVADLNRLSDRFARLWAEHRVGRHTVHTKTVRHPRAGALRLDCDVLTVPGSDLHVTVFTTEPGSASQERLRLLTEAEVPPSVVPVR